VFVPGQEIGQVCRQFIVNHYTTATSFIKNGDFYSVSKGVFLVDVTQFNIFNDNMIVNIVVGQVIRNLANVNMVANGAVVNGGVVQAAISDYSATKLNGPGVVANFNDSGKLYITNILRYKYLTYKNLIPMSGRNTLLF